MRVFTEPLLKARETFARQRALGPPLDWPSDIFARRGYPRSPPVAPRRSRSLRTAKLLTSISCSPAIAAQHRQRARDRTAFAVESSYPDRWLHCPPGQHPQASRARSPLWLPTRVARSAATRGDRQGHARQGQERDPAGTSEREGQGAARKGRWARAQGDGQGSDIKGGTLVLGVARMMAT
jgi:hypothetical protein